MSIEIIYQGFRYNKKTKKRDIPVGVQRARGQSATVADDFWKNCNDRHLPDFNPETEENDEKKT